jgi:hypothetical protein
MTLREFYRLICNLFNSGEPLPYKYTRRDGYWKMTKGFMNHGGTVMSSGNYLKLCQLVRDERDQQQRPKTKKRKQKFTVKNKYIGD